MLFKISAGLSFIWFFCTLLLGLLEPVAISEGEFPPTRQISDAAKTSIHSPSLSDAKKLYDPIFLNAAPQDQHIFLTWSKHPSIKVPIYNVHWRSVGSYRWNKMTITGKEYHAVTNLSNHIDYEFYITLAHFPHIRSRKITQTPRPRDYCAGLFCSQYEADLWVQTTGINPLTLKCRGMFIGSWDINSPNCFYYNSDGSVNFLLNRYVDSIFDPPPDRSLEWTRLITIQTLWPLANPFTNQNDFPVQIIKEDIPLIGNVTAFAEANTYKIKYHNELSSRITWFAPIEPIRGHAIYHEGHGGSGVEIGADSIDWLLKKGMSVINIDMPLSGANSPDISDALQNHYDFVRLHDGSQSPIALFLLPVKIAVDMIYDRVKTQQTNMKLLMIGRSGGGWTTSIYSAIDPRIQVAVPIAGLKPLSMRLSEPSLRDLGDYEQISPDLYDVVAYEDIMKTAGSIGSLFIYNTFDPCCFSVTKDSDLVEYLKDVSTRYNKPINVWVDAENLEHSISAQGYEVLDDFLRSVNFW